MWQDYVIAIGQWFFVVSLIPAIRAKGKPPLFTSVSTGVILITFGFTFGTMGMWNSCIATTTVGLMWEAIAIQTVLGRSRGKHVNENGAGHERI